jgi:hypothetical protein
VPRLRKKHLPHRANIQDLAAETAEGETYSAPRTDVPAYFEQKSRLVVDRRSASPTAGQEVVSTAFVVILIEDDTLPGALVTMFPGQPRERTAEVISSEYFDYSRKTPNHVELYLA